jgi:O-antigen/teichoic acid export membrane protein
MDIKKRLNFNFLDYNLVILIIGRIAIATASIVAVRVTTEYLTPSELGAISQLNSLANFYSVTLIIPFAHFMNRGLLEWFQINRLKKNSKIFLFYILFIFLIVLILTFILQYNYRIINGFSLNVTVLLVGLIFLTTAISSFGTTSLNILGFRTAFVLFTNFTVWGSLLFSLLFVTLNKNALNWTLGQICGLTMGCISLMFFFDKANNKFEKKINNEEVIFSVKSIFNFSWPILITAALWWIQSQSYKFIISSKQGIANVGYFAIGYSLGSMPIALYESIIGQYLEPKFLKSLLNQNEQGKGKAWDKYASVYLPGLILSTILTLVSIKYAAKILLNESYQEAAINIAIGAVLIECVRAAGSMMYHLGTAKMDNKITILPVSVGAILSPLFVYIFSNYSPIFGTLSGLFITNIIVFSIIIIFSKKALPINWPISKIITTLLYCIPIIILTLVMNNLYPNASWFYSFLFIIINLVYVLIVIYFSKLFKS